MEESKKTRGKQKIEIKEIKESKILYNTFVKRKSGVYKKASDLSTLCGARVDILMFSPCGRPFCYGNPSLQSMTRTGLDEGNPLEGGNDDQLLVEDDKLEIEELNEKNDALSDQLYVEKAGEKKLKGILKNMNSNDWWEAKVQDFNYEEAKAMEASLTELRNKLTKELSIKCTGENTSIGEDLFDIIYPPNKKSRGANLDDPMASLTNASGSGGHALTFSPSNHCQGENPIFLYNASNENTEGSGSQDLAFSPPNQH